MFQLVIRIKVIIELELKDRELTAVFHNDALFVARTLAAPFPSSSSTNPSTTTHHSTLYIETSTMKTTASILLATAATAAAFTPTSNPSTTSTQLNSAQSDLEALAVDLNPSIKYYDPLRLTTWNFWEQGDEATIGFLRHAEIK